MKDGFRITVETLHAADRGEQSNALDLPKDQLKKREVVFLDIADDQHLKKSASYKILLAFLNMHFQDHTEHNNVGEFTSEKTGRGPLAVGWAQEHEPVICAYKVVSVNFKWFGLQGRVEKLIHATYPRLFVKFHRETFCWIDQWYDLSFDDIRAIEDETASKLKDQIDEGSIKGMVVADGSDRKKSSSESSSAEETGRSK